MEREAINNREGLIRSAIRKIKQSYREYRTKKYYEEFDAESYMVYYGPQVNDNVRAEVEQHFIEFDADSFDNMPEYK